MSGRLPPPIDSNGPLTARFGLEFPTFYSGNPLNRLSFLRENYEFLRSTFAQSKYLLLKPTERYELNPLTKSDAELSFLDYPAVENHGFKGLYEGVSTDDEYIATYNSEEEEARPIVVFLGIDEADTESGWAWQEWQGRPYWALIWNKEEVVWDEQMSQFREARNLKVGYRDAAILAMAKSYLDWNNRNRFCGGCGSRTLSIHAGGKRVCPETDKAKVDADGVPVKRSFCFTRVKRSVHNINFPRTDPTVIMAVLDHTGTKMLLGRRGNWPAGFYSCLAGFCEPGESIEDSVRREVFEEAGVTASRVVLHSSQPWPYPNSLMIGCIAEAVEGKETISLKHDKELDDARWFPIEEVAKAISALPKDLVLGDLTKEEKEAEGNEPDLKIPGSFAIANRLLFAVAKTLAPPKAESSSL
ncbi:hypothetical protein BJ508DRAFT_321952 [Ascobolus immersus RN42]|uniref:NAD(+) diphosphatase n=1 Tax=Ascobolus immersus RN42 TaxID=1160509 RepID=A0A3N4INJ4_ASCIM|nr:hypothetical protein BJ508DRAFT_321952 [Ascobolus immersus RN42]